MCSFLCRRTDFTAPVLKSRRAELTPAAFIGALRCVADEVDAEQPARTAPIAVPSVLVKCRKAARSQSIGARAGIHFAEGDALQSAGDGTRGYQVDGQRLEELRKAVRVECIKAHCDLNAAYEVFDATVEAVLQTPTLLQQTAAEYSAEGPRPAFSAVQTRSKRSRVHRPVLRAVPRAGTGPVIRFKGLARHQVLLPQDAAKIAVITTAAILLSAVVVGALSAGGYLGETSVTVTFDTMYYSGLMTVGAAVRGAWAAAAAALAQVMPYLTAPLLAIYGLCASVTASMAGAWAWLSSIGTDVTIPTTTAEFTPSFDCVCDGVDCVCKILVGK